MEQCLRLALWMFLFIGYLQAKPTTKPQGFNKDDISFTSLKKISCDVKFTSPINVQKHCYFAALTCFMDELMRAADKCTNDKLINDTFEALEQNTEIQEQHDNTTACQLEKSEKPFAGFVEDMKVFVEQVNSDKMVKC